VSPPIVLPRHPAPSAPLVLDLGHGRRAPCRPVDLLQRGAGAGLHGADHRTLHQRRLGDAHPAAALLLDQLLDGELGGEHGGAEVDQHQHPFAVVGGHDRLGDQGGVGADAAVGGAAGGADADVAGHLRGQLDHALGHLGRMGHHHQAHAHARRHRPMFDHAERRWVITHWPVCVVKGRSAVAAAPPSR
jgi:hypothetical protein